MQDQPGGDDLPVLAAAGAGGVVAELVLGGGPVSAVVAGGMVPVAVQAAAVVHRRWRDKAGRALQVAADALDAGLDIFDERLPGHDERVELLARVIEAAARSTLEAKVTALGRVLADGLREEGDTDEALLLAAALAAIEGPHVGVLAHLHAHPQIPAELVRAGVESSIGWRPDQVAHELPQVGGVVEAVFAVLAGHGLIRDAGAINYPGTIGPSIWRIATLGRRCLFLLDTDREELG